MKISIARVYHGGGRRWFSLRAACRAEAWRLVKARCFKMDYERYDEMSIRLVDRVARMLESQHRRMTP